jgi:hypothetical protein
MIRVVHPGSQITEPDAGFLPIPDPGGQKGTGFWIRNTGEDPPRYRAPGSERISPGVGAAGRPSSPSCRVGRRPPS